MIGQIRVEFIFAVVIFGLIILFIASQINTLLTISLTTSKSDDLRVKAISVITILVEDKGEPEDWYNSPENAERIGLVDQRSYNLITNKITALNNDCTLLDYFDLEGYRLKIYQVEQQVLFCGYESLAPPTTIITRNVFIDGIPGNITLELWL